MPTNAAASLSNYAPAALLLSNAPATLAQTGASSYTLDLGQIVLGASDVSEFIALTNLAPAGGDLLSGSFSTSGDAAFTNTLISPVTALAPGQSITTLAVTLGGATAGAFSETITLDANGSSGGVDTGDLTPITLTVTGVVGDGPHVLASVGIIARGGIGQTTGPNSYTLNIGQVAQGAMGVGLTGSFWIDNVQNSFADFLSGTISVSGDPNFTNTGLGAFSGVLNNEYDTAPTIRLNTGTAGHFSETLTIHPVSTNGAHNAVALPDFTLTIVGDVLGPSFPSGPATAGLQAGEPSPVGPVTVVTQTSANHYTLDFGTVSEGATILGQPFDIINTAIGQADSLSGNITASGDPAFTNTFFDFTGLIPASFGSSPSKITFNTDTAGSFSETITVNLTDTNSSGGSTPLAPLILTVTGVVEPGVIAQPGVGSFSGAAMFNATNDDFTDFQIDFGQVGLGSSATKTFTIRNSGLALADLLSGAFTVTGDTHFINDLALSSGLASGQSSGASTITLDASTPGAFGETITFNPTGTNSGGHAYALKPLTLHVQATVEGSSPPPPGHILAAAGLAVSGPGALTLTAVNSYTLDFGSIVQGASLAAEGLSISNIAAAMADTLSGSFTVSGSSAFTNSGLSAFSGLASGQSDTAPTITLNTSAAGTFSETITISPTGSNSGGYSGALSPITLTVTGTVLAPPPPPPPPHTLAAVGIQLASGAIPLDPTGPYSYTFDFGTIAAGAAVGTEAFHLFNSAAFGADLLSGSFSTAGDASAFITTGFNAFSGLQSNGFIVDPTITVDTSHTGFFTETITLNPTGSNSSGYSGALHPITFTLEAHVANFLYLPTTVTTIHGGPGFNNVVAAPGTLLAGDVIDGGPGGENTLQLTGASVDGPGGTIVTPFDLSAPTTLTGIHEVDVEEGQTVILRDGTNFDIQVASGQPGASANTPGATIYGANNTDVIQLGGYADTVYLTSSTEAVCGSTGLAIIYESVGAMGATVVGGSGGAILNLTGGGNFTMGDNITEVDSVFLTNPSSDHLPFTWNVQLNGIAGLTAEDDNTGTTGDTLAAGGLNQTLFGNGNMVTLIGYSGGYTTFRPSAHTTIQGMATTGNVIQVSNGFGAPMLAFVEAADNTHGTLTITTASQTLAVDLTGSFDPAQFHVFGNDISYGAWHG